MPGGSRSTRRGVRRAALGDAAPDDERARADRYHLDRDRTRFIVGRGSLRAILGRYLGASRAA